MIFSYVMWNNLVHNIPKNKQHLIRTSEHEYKTGKFHLVNPAEGRKFLKMFDGYQNFLKHGIEIISVVKTERGKEFDFHEE